MRDCFDKTPSWLHIRDLKALDTEVRTIVDLIHPDFDFTTYERMFIDVVRLFIGDYPGYKATNTDYHDLSHTLAVLLATARLLHGLHIERGTLDKRSVTLGLYAALMHDVGYIQEIGDDEGSGAKYTLIHVERGIVFMQQYFTEHGIPDEDSLDCAAMLRCTDLNIAVSDLAFSTPSAMLVGLALGAADILAQMADELYMEKLPGLYREFREAGILTYESEYDLMRETLNFHKIMRLRLQEDLKGVDRSMRAHFRARWRADTDVYEDNICKNMQYLEHILEQHGPDYHVCLRRKRDRRPPFF
ncbi:MAG: metal-dependent phosphohydrolase [Desulfovibrionaceae bacterium]